MRLIRGAAGAGKSAQVLQEFRDALRSRRQRVRIVVPTATLVRHFQHQLARAGEVCPPSSVVSLRRLIEENAPGLKPIPDGLLRALVRDTLRRLKPPEFSEVAETSGMVSVVLDTIALFENAGATAEKVGTVRRLSGHAKAFERIWRDVAATMRERGYASRTEVVRAAAAHIGGLRIWMDGFVTFSPIEMEFIRAAARSCDFTLTLTDSPATEETRRAAVQLGAADRLLAGASRRPGTEVVQAISIERECDEIARRILELRESGIPFRETGVALRDESSYLPLLRGVFERFGIPARFYFSSALREHPASLFLNGLIESALNGWEFGRTLDALRAHPGWGVSAAMDRLDFAARAAMPASSAQELLKHCADDETLTKRLHECFAIADWVTEPRAPAEWVARLQDFAMSVYRPGMLDGDGVNQFTVESQRSHVSGLQAWTDAIESVRDFWPAGSGPISLESFWLVAAESVEGASVRIRDDRRDVVHVMNAYEARQWDVAALFVCGVTARDYPQRHQRNLLLSDADFDALRRAGILLRKASDLDQEEKVLFQALRTRARQTLVLSWPAHDAAGKKVQSSRYVMELAPVAKARRCRPAMASLRLGAGARRIESASLLEQMAALHQRVSMTALEELTQCRFKFFAGRTLALKDRPEMPSERLKPLVWGSILHQALEEWLKNNREGDFVPFFEAAFDNACREEHLPQGYKLEAERIQLRETARKVSATEKWTPISSEAEVEVALEFPLGITVSGRIDRLDRLSDRECVIVDYKSSRIARVEKMVESTTRLQGPLYALAARDKLHLKTLAMMYLAVREDKRFGWGEVPNADLGLKPMPENWIEDAKARTVERITDFLSGAIQADPAERDECRWCDFAQACRYTEKRELVMIEGAGG